MNILIIGGLHGNEPLGINLVDRIRNLKPNNVTAIFGNEKAINQQVRFLEQDLNRVFDLPEAESLEKIRAKEILEFINQDNFDLILDFHNTCCPQNNCSFVGDNCDVNLFRISQFLSLNRVIVADYNCINKFVPNCISIEISLDDELNSVDYWLEQITKLSQIETLSNLPQTNQKLQKYRFSYRVTTEQKEDLELSNWSAFKAISQNDKVKLSLNPETEYYSIFIADNYTPQNYAGLIVIK
jgi:Succinylglutamate desuccinylase / Aspartoacylase family